jgi:hypothetical protein
LQSLVEQNDRIALESIMNPRKLDEVQHPLPEGWPLSLLADILKVGPPLLSEIVTCLESIDDVQKFANLVKMFLPEHETEIMSTKRNRRVYKFCFFFGKKYYPLPANTDCPPAQWVNSMPVELLAMSYSEYHELQMRPGYLLLLSLVIYPYEGDERDMEDDEVPFDPANLPTAKWKPTISDTAWLEDLMERLTIGGKWEAPMGFTFIKTAEKKFKLRQAKDTPEVKETIRRTLLIAKKLGIETEYKPGKSGEEKAKTLIEVFGGARIPLLDKVQRMVGEDIVHKIPAQGWEPEDLHKMTDGTRFEGVGEFADWACSQTGCVMLDTAFDNCEYVEGMAEPLFKWTKRNVDILTEEWPKVQKLRAKIDHIVEWLEADKVNHFNDLVNSLLKSAPLLVVTKRKQRSYDPWEHICELDMNTGEDEDDDDSRE